MNALWWQKKQKYILEARFFRCNEYPDFYREVSGNCQGLLSLKIYPQIGPLGGGSILHCVPFIITFVSVQLAGDAHLTVMGREVLH